MVRINENWRQMAKRVIASDGVSMDMTFRSVWEASIYISERMECQRGTARKEIRKAIKIGCKRYGFYWRFEEYDKN